MKIRTKIFLSFFISILIMVLVGTTSFYYFSKKTLSESIGEHMKTTVNLVASNVDSILSGYKQSAEIFSESSIFDVFFEKEASLINYDDILGELERETNELKNEISAIYKIKVLNKNGIVVMSTDKGDIGQDKSLGEGFLRGQEEAYIRDLHFSTTINAPGLDISIPIIRDNVFKGMVVVDFKSDEIYSVLLDQAGPWETRETYLVNQDSLMVSPSLFVEDAFLKQEIKTENSEICFNAFRKIGEAIGIEGHNIKEFLLFNNYRGVPVIGVHAHIPQMTWCVLVEIEESDFVSSLNPLLLFSIMLSSLILVTFFIVATIIGRTISAPILELKKGVEIIGKGNIDYRVGTSSKDEIGALSRSFDKMTLAIKKARTNINEKVEKQTKEIVERDKDLSEQQTAILNVLDDVTREKEKTVLEKEKTEILLQSIGDGVFAVNDRLEIIAFNSSASKISGFSREEALDKKYNEILKFVDEEDGSPKDDFIKKVMDEKKILEMPEGTVLIRKDGEKVPVADSAAPIRNDDGDIFGCIIVFRDITQTRKVEKMKSEFVSIASHQLRTPLTGIQWVSERLLKISNQLPEKERGYINDIYMSSKRLSRLVDDLLNVSRIEGGRIAVTPEKIEVVEFFENYFKEIRPLTTEKNINFVFDEKPDSLNVITDRSALQNIIQSLVSNAIEYTPNDGNIEVTLGQKGENFLFTVKDTGIGIPKKDRETIFEKFTRGANALAVKTDGTGFGLYITKQTVDLLKGSVRFDSVENKGTTFFVELPVESKVVKGDKGLV